MAFGWIGSTTAFGDVVGTIDLMRARHRLRRRATFSNVVQMPAKANSGRSSLSANHTTSFFIVTEVWLPGAYSRRRSNVWPGLLRCPYLR